MSGDLKPPGRVPLTVRKDLRDQWDSKRPKFEAKISGILEKPWKIDIKPLSIYPYAAQSDYDRSLLGQCIAEYLTALIKYLDRFINSQGDAGRDQLNLVCPTSTITLSASTDVRVNGVKIEEGQLRLLFNPEELGGMTYDMAQHLEDAVSEAPEPLGPDGRVPISLKVRKSIKDGYDDQIFQYLSTARSELRNPQLRFEPDFNGINDMMMATYPDRLWEWQDTVGEKSLEYFSSFVDVLRNEGFGDDYMLRNRFEQAVPRGIVVLRMVPELVDENNWPIHNRAILEDGMLVIETKPNRLGSSADAATRDLLTLL